jgi:hypothetical protein
MMGPVVAAGFAAILWVLDDGHGTPVGFISNRNALIACFFGVLSLILHDKWYKEKRLKCKIAALISLALSLLAAEAGIATCGYLFAYAVFIENNTWRRKFLNLLPYASVVIAWRIVWSMLGYGTRNIGLYIDPAREPLTFIAGMWDKMVLFLGSLMAGISADISLMVGGKGRMLLIGSELIVLAILGAAFFALIKRDRAARFWLCGMVLAIVPSCATFPCDRLLVFASIGAMGLMGQFFVFVFGNKEFYKSRPVLKGVSLGVAVMLLGSNFVLSPAGLTIRTMYPLGPGELTEKVFIPPFKDEEIANQNLIVINPPSTFLAMCSPYIFDADYENKPKRIWALCSSFYGPTEVTRIDEYSISVRPTGGYMAFALDRLFWNEKNLMEAGQEIELDGMVVTISEVNAEGMPTEAMFRFDKPLEDESYRWIKWSYGYYEPYVPGTMGETEVLRGGTLKGGIQQLIKGGK